MAQARPAAVQDAAEILLVECSAEALDFFAKELEAHLPVRVDKVLARDLVKAVSRRKATGRWAAAVTSFFHLPEVDRRLSRTGVPVIALLAGAHIETLQRLAQLPPGTRVGVASGDHETAHNLEHSIVNAGLPNIALVGSCPAEGPGLQRLLKQVEAMVCSSPAAQRVREIAGPATQVIIDDRALDKRAIEMLTAILVRQEGERTPPAWGAARETPKKGDDALSRTSPRRTRARASRSP